jgi:hypothetical protein
MKTEAWATLFTLSALAGCFPSTVDLPCYSLDNGGAELGGLGDWEPGPEVVGSVVSEVDGLTPAQGAWFFTMALEPGDSASLEQRCSPVIEVLQCSLEGVISTEVGAWGSASIQLLDQAGVLSSEAGTGPMESEQGDWRHFGLSLTIPEGAHEIRVVIEGNAAEAEGGAVSWDSLELYWEDAVSGAS